MGIEENRLSDDELDAVSGGYIVNLKGKYFIVDSEGKMIRIGGKSQKGFDKLTDAQLMAALARESLTEITMEEWMALGRGDDSGYPDTIRPKPW